jgi:membrane protein
MHPLLRHPALFKRALAHALEDDALNIAQSAAYSAIVALFPALIVFAALVPLLPDTAPIRYELADVVQRILPADVTPLLESYFSSSKEGVTSTRALILSILVSISGASGVIATFMEGLRRAYRLPPDCWSFWSRRARALLLVPLSLIPLAASSLLVLFGHFLATWLAGHGTPQQSGPIYVFVITVRWLVALAGSVGLIALLYKLGTPLRLSWRSTLPGALLATALWFASTLVFGWYVTRFANYSRVYGSLGAGIALLFWLYITSLSVLCGGEFNGQLRSARIAAADPLPLPPSAPLA